MAKGIPKYFDNIIRQRERERYLENVGYFPEEFAENSEASLQWTYNPRTKKSKEYFAKTYEQKLPLRPKQGKTRVRKKAS